MADKKHYSFAAEVKEEIAKKKYDDDCLRSLCSAFAKVSGSIRVSSKGPEIDLATESSATAKMLYQAFSNLFGVSCRFAYTKGMGFSTKVRYHCLVSEAPLLLGDLEVDYLSGKIPKRLVASKEQEASYLAGAFLAAGSVNSPYSSNYHLEIALGDEAYARWLSHMINKTAGHAFLSKITKRREKWVVYIKRGEQIANFLIYIGATDSCLKFENIRMERDFANIGNRLSNLDNANMSKTLSAANRQVSEIKALNEDRDYMNSLSEKVRILMKIRLDKPDASLEELSSILSKEIACTVTKSNVNHIFRKIHEDYSRRSK